MKKILSVALILFFSAICLAQVYAEGIHKADLEKINQKITELDKKINANPEEVSNYSHRGLWFFKKGNYDQAIRDFTKYIEKKPESNIATLLRGHCYYIKGDYKAAISAFTYVLGIRGPYGSYEYFAYANLAATYLKMKSYDRAWDFLRKAEPLNNVNEQGTVGFTLIKTFDELKKELMEVAPPTEDVSLNGIVRLKSGKEFKGKVIERTNRQITLQTDNGSIVLPVNMLDEETAAKFGDIQAQAPSTTPQPKGNPLTQNLTPYKGELTAEEIVGKMRAAYKSMDTYKSIGTVDTTQNMQGQQFSQTTDFSMIFKKPDLYKIIFSMATGRMHLPSKGAVWSDGKQRYLYMGMMNAYFPMDDDQMALGVSVGISSGASLVIPPLFFDFFDKGMPIGIASLDAPFVMGLDAIEGKECFVISGDSKIFRTETYWIDSRNYMIVQYFVDMSPPEGGRKMPEVTDEQLEEVLENMGQEVTQENKDKMRRQIKESQEEMGSLSVNGASLLQRYSEISTPELTAADFVFNVPEGTVRKKSMMGLMPKQK